MEHGIELTYDEEKKGFILLVDDGHNYIAPFFTLEKLEKWLLEAQGYVRNIKMDIEVKEFVEELSKAKNKREMKEAISQLAEKLNEQR